MKADLRTCAQCGPITNKDLVMKVCSVCQAARYCGAACQGLHWEAHKPECKRIVAETKAVARSKLKADLRTCAQCGPITDKAISMRVCSACNAARYCGVACQRLHWKAHKPECKRIKAESDAVKDSDGAGPSNA